MTRAERSQRHRDKLRTPPPPASELALARLRSAEGELFLRDEASVYRAAVEHEMLISTAIMRRVFAGFVARYGAAIAAQLDVPTDRLRPILHDALAMFLAEYDAATSPARIALLLDRIVASWRRFPPPPTSATLPPWEPPATFKEVQDRERAARIKLEKLKLETRAGLRLDYGEAYHLIIGIAREMSMFAQERLGILAVPMILSGLALIQPFAAHTTHEAIASKMRELLTELADPAWRAQHVPELSADIERPPVPCWRDTRPSQAIRSRRRSRD